MSDIQTQLPVKLTDNTNTAGITASSALLVDLSATGANATPLVATGSGTAGTAASGVMTVQGIASMTPIQVSQATAANLNATVVQATAANLNATVIGAGSAGTANSGVMTVQGIASMTPVQVSQATASNLNAAVVGTGIAGTPAGGVLSVQGVVGGTTIPVSSSPTTFTATTGSVTTASTDITTGTLSAANGALITVNGTYAGVNLSFFASDDDGTTYYPVTAVRSDNAAAETTSGVLTANQSRAWFVYTASANRIRVSSTAFTSGSASVSITPLANADTTVVVAKGAGVAGTADSSVMTVQGIASMTPVQVSQATAASLNATVIGAGSAGSANAGVVTVQGIASMTPVQVSQATASNLNATVVQSTASSLNATVIGAGSAGTANAGVVTVQGIASMTPVQVSQATASNLNAAVVGIGTAGSPSGGVLSVQGVSGGQPLAVAVSASLGTPVAEAITQTAIANSSTGTCTYTTTVATDFYLKQIIAASSGGPCKITVDYGAGPTVVFIGFYSAASPTLSVTFAQPIVITGGGIAVNVKIQNNAGSAQDVYATIIGEEI